MSIAFRTPAPPLSQFINRLWLVDGFDASHRRERVLPDGSMQIIISLCHDRFTIYDRAHPDRDTTLSGAIVVGASTHFSIIHTDEVISTIGVHFKPGGARPFLALPINELHDREEDLDTLWGRAATQELRERIHEADGPDAKLQVLEAFMRARLAARDAHHPAVAFAVREFDQVPHTRTIGDVTNLIGLSRRRFIELFEQAVGLTPKRFCRLRRFQEVLARASKGRLIEWAEVAAACGYFDQAHLIHDFRAFSGLTPSEYLRNRTQFQNHVRLD